MSQSQKAGGAVNRPLYENDQNRADEQRIADVVGRMTRCTFNKMPMSYRLDYAAVRDMEIIGWAEIKKRNYEFRKYSDFIISLGKYTAALHLSEDTNLPSRFYIQFGKGIYKHIPVFPIVTRWGGRADRNDPQDMEPMAVIDWDCFELIGQVE